jgi:hypothetical protein
MRLPKQSAPVQRNQRDLKADQVKTTAVTQSGCCIQVAGVCVASSPFC